MTLSRSLAPITAAAIALVVAAPALAEETATHANPAPIDINRSPNWWERVGPAEPYPSTISVAGRVGTITKVTVELVGYSHSWPSDVDMQLVGPQGQRTILMSDAGGRCDTFNYTLTLDDDAPTPLPGECPFFGQGPIVPGTYRPANYDDRYGYGTLEGPYPSTLSVFNGTNPNGVWSLYVFDDWPHDDGEFAGGWSLTITTIDAPPTIQAPASVEADATGPAGATVVYSVTATDDVDPSPTVACTPASGSVFPIGATTVTCTATDDASNSAQATFVVLVLGADDQLDNLQETILGYDLAPDGFANSLIVKLQAALDALAADDSATGCTALQDFLNQVAAQRGKKLTEAQADALTAAATRIRSVLTC